MTVLNLKSLGDGARPVLQTQSGGGHCVGSMTCTGHATSPTLFTTGRCRQ